MITKYDEYVNESMIGDIRAKLKGLLNNFQFRENLQRKIMKFNNPKASLVIMVIYFIYVMCKALKIHPTEHIPYLLMVIPWWFAIIMSVLRFPINNMRKRMIQRKMTEICGNLNGYLFKSNVYAVLGDTNNVKEFIERIKLDGKIEDGNILDFDNIYVIDLAKQFNKETFVKKVDTSHSEVDPLGEEEWNDDVAERPEDAFTIRHNGTALYYNLTQFEEEYGVKLRQITKVNDFLDAFDIKKATPREMEIKRARQEALNIRLEQERRNRRGDFDYEAYIRNRRPQQPENDDDNDDEIPRNRRNYMVPGFDINPIQPVDRD